MKRHLSIRTSRILPLLLLAALLCFPALSQAQQVDTAFYKNGRIQTVTLHGARETRYINYEEDSGKPSSVTHQGNFNGCGMPVGTDTFFSSAGRIEKTIDYDNRKSKTEEGCHDTWTTTKQVIYHRNGKPRLVSYQKSCYECSPCDCGTWTYYNERGKVIKRIQKGDCYNQRPCP